MQPGRQNTFQPYLNVKNAYNPRGQNVLQQIFKDHFENFKEQYDEKYDPLSCTSFYLCPSCHQKRTLLFSEQVIHKVLPHSF